MSSDATFADALNVANLLIPPSTGHVEIDAQSYVDASGDDAVRVLVILDDNVDESQITGEEVIKLKRSIRDALVHRGFQQFPYVFLVKRSERTQDKG